MSNIPVSNRPTVRLERPFFAESRAGRAAFRLGTAAVALAVALGGCGTTKFSDTGRTATEQLLISSAMEEVVDEYDYSRLSGLKVYIKVANTVTDSDYLKSLIRQQLAANGVFIKDKEEEAEYILEVAPGTVGTNRYELMYGIPETTIPAIGTLTNATSIPEFALVKRTDQKAEIKLNMWAYNKTTGAIVWQSGIRSKSSKLRDRWIFGAGPFTTASYDGNGVRLGADKAPLSTTFGERVSGDEKPSVQSEAAYQELDAKALERLQKIREEGLAKALEDAKANGEAFELEGTPDQDDAAENAESDDAAKSDATSSEKTDDSSPENGATPTNAEPAKSPAAPTAPTEPTATPPAAPGKTEIRLVDESAKAPAVDDELKLDFGGGAQLDLKSVYVPDGTRRR